MDILCEECNKTFEPSKEQEQEIADQAKAGQRTFIVRCPVCHDIVFTKPLVLMGIADELPDPMDEIEDNRVFYCPTPQCIGFVEYENKTYECTSCGSSWENKKELYHDITKIVEKYPHRKKVYVKIKNGWKNIPFGTSPHNYGSMVQNDETDELPSSF